MEISNNIARCNYQLLSLALLHSPQVGRKKIPQDETDPPLTSFSIASSSSYMNKSKTNTRPGLKRTYLSLESSVSRPVLRKPNNRYSEKKVHIYG